MRPFSPLALIALTLASCTTPRAGRPPAADTLYVVNKDQPPIPFRIPGWHAQIRLSLANKIAVPPDEVLAFITADNVSMGFTNRPRAAPVDARWRDDCVAALAGLPEAVRTLAGEHLISIYPVVDLGGSAYTEAVSDANQHIVGGFIAVDVAVLDRAANDWATWKERSPFRAPNTYIEGVIEDAAGNTRASALQYILLHELGHIIAFSSASLPKWNTLPVERVAGFPYAALSWVAQDGKLVAKDASFTVRSKVHYYAHPDRALALADAVAAYDGVVASGFPTLYAATGVDDDFADSFANYVHVVLMKRPFRIALHQEGSPDRVIESCWDQPRCAAKRKFFEALIAGATNGAPRR